MEKAPLQFCCVRSEQSHFKTFRDIERLSPRYLFQASYLSLYFC